MAFSTTAWDSAGRSMSILQAQVSARRRIRISRCRRGKNTPEEAFKRIANSGGIDIPIAGYEKPLHLSAKLAGKIQLLGHASQQFLDHPAAELFERNIGNTRALFRNIGNILRDLRHQLHEQGFSGVMEKHKLALNVPLMRGLSPAACNICATARIHPNDGRKSQTDA